MKTLSETKSALPNSRPDQCSEWFCVRSKTKHEHIAAASLQSLESVEVFFPRVRFRRKTVRGSAWVTEGMFPNYLFARFNRQMGRAVKHAYGVLTVVHFGEHWPTIPDETIDHLRQSVGMEEVHVVEEIFEPGKQLEVIAGPFKGLDVVVLSSLPAPGRIRVLMDFLGRQTALEFPTAILLGKTNPRYGIGQFAVPEKISVFQG